MGHGWSAVASCVPVPFFSIGPQYHAVQVLEGSDGRLEAGGGADMRRSAAESRDRETVTGEEKFPAKLSVVGPQTSQFWE